MLKWTVKPVATQRRSLCGTSEINTSTGATTTPKTRPQKRRRHSTGRRSVYRKNSFDLDIDKENQFTSTPIKSSSEQCVLRDVSNLTITSTTATTPKSRSAKKVKKKKCVDPLHQENYFKPFESVDSHIESVLVEEKEGVRMLMKKRRLRDTATAAVAYSPCFLNTPLGKLLKSDEPQNKKMKFDHVNDFLHHINFITSPEDRVNSTTMECKSTKAIKNEQVKISPLVRKFSQLNNSSLIDDLSLDEIVDAILNSSETEKKPNSRCSTDSGFKSSTTESHQLEGNFRCKCKKTSTPTSERTIINMDETFNERCVDDFAKCRKRGATPDDDNFTLKRQRCIRRRKTDDEKKSALEIPKDEIVFGDDSFDSNVDTPLKMNETFTLNENPRRFRRCLLFESPTSFSESGSVANCSLREVRGSMDLSITCKNGELHVNVIRCKDLYRSTSEKQINAYVKVYLTDDDGSRKRDNGGSRLQRTAVQADSSRPFFNHIFKFPFIGKQNLREQRVYLEVWHRDRSLRTSEFLGCMSFDVKDAFRKTISGSYRLLPQSSGRCQNVPSLVPQIEPSSTVIASIDNTSRSTTMCDSRSSVESAEGIVDVIDLKHTTSKTVLIEQQKHADENLFLRYLELDPTEGPEAIPAAMQRKATGNKNGRTPFTHTKKLIRAPKSGFGFSVVWTHPPRIERVEKGLPAEKAGILPGDYIIFVDKHNVVMMPEIDILNLIKSYGSQLTLEIFRRTQTKNGSVPSVRRLNSTGTCSTTGLPATKEVQRRPSTVCSTTNTASVDFTRRKLHLPQVTFSAEKPSDGQEENRKKAMYQLISKEQQYATGLQFAVTRFVSALAERKDLITPSEHKVLFQNSEEILRITEDILDSIAGEGNEPSMSNLIRTYHSKSNEITTAYRRYCSGIKKADCMLVNKTRNSNSEFVRFLQTPAIPRRRPDITTFIHKPLEHYRDILKAFTVIQGYTKSNFEDYSVINQLVHDLQHTYREITVEAGLMEPMGEGRPLLTVQDLENRLVFTKCKPFVLNKPGRQWIFGGDLGRVEGRNVRQYWTLLFSDLLLFAKVSRDRVLFIIEDPLPLVNVTDTFFNVRKKDTEFRITVAPGGRLATSPTVHCGPDLSRTPKKSAGKRTVVLRAPTTELKAVWQNLLQRQIFHVNSIGGGIGTDGSSLSSPLESPEAPITSSVVTLQSAESLSMIRQHHRQTPQNTINEREMQKQIDALIEHKCKQLSKNNSGKGNAIHLEKWMKGQLDGAEDAELEPLSEEWTEEMLRQRSQELQLIDSQGNITGTNTHQHQQHHHHHHHHQHQQLQQRSEYGRNESRYEDIINSSSDHEQSPSKSTTTESQVTVRSSPLVPETVPVCRQCHKNCLSSADKPIIMETRKDENDNKEDHDDWRPLLLMGLSAINPAKSLVKLDPFSTPIPQINVAPPTPESSKTPSTDHKVFESCSCKHNNIEDFETKNIDVDMSDDSPQTEEHPYHSLSSSNLTLRRYGTVSSLERLGDEEHEDKWEDRSSEDEAEEKGIDNEAFYHSSIRSWTAKAGSFVAEKMSFFEEYRNPGRFFDRYLKGNEVTVNGDDLQEDETSGATSGEEIWGTPTSGGELEDPLSSPNYEGKQSPYDGSISSDNDDTELMMDELLMTPPISGAIMRGLLPRRTLEPLIEEDFSESCTPTSSSGTPTEPSLSPEQGNGTGGVADTCLTAVENKKEKEREEMMKGVVPKMHRSESYRRIVEAAESQVEEEIDALSFFDRFKPTVKFVNIERVPRARSVKIFEFFNMKRGRLHQTVPEDKQLIKVFSKEGTVSDNVPTSYSDKQLSPSRLLKDKQMDRRFWKQLSRRRGSTKNGNLPA